MGPLLWERRRRDELWGGIVSPVDGYVYGACRSKCSTIDTRNGRASGATGFARLELRAG